MLLFYNFLQYNLTFNWYHLNFLSEINKSMNIIPKNSDIFYYLLLLKLINSFIKPNHFIVLQKLDLIRWWYRIAQPEVSIICIFFIIFIWFLKFLKRVNKFPLTKNVLSVFYIVKILYENNGTDFQLRGY